MKRFLLTVTRPRTLVKVIASGIAMISNTIQLSEVSDEWGEPLPSREREWHNRAVLAAFEGRQIRNHVGFSDGE